MMMKRPAAIRMIPLVLIALVLSVFYTGCSAPGPAQSSSSGSQQSSSQSDSGTSAPAQKVTIRFAHCWTGGDAKAAYVEPMLQKYADEHKDWIDLQIEATSGDDYRTAIQVEVAAGSTPDVFIYWGASNIIPMVNADAILDMDAYVQVSKTTKYDQYSDSYLKMYSHNDKRYAFPIEAYGGFFMVNKKLFDQFGLAYPKNYEDMKQVSEVFLENDIIPFAMTSKNGDNGALFFSSLVYQLPNGYRETQDMLTTYNFNTPSNLKAAQIIDDMRELGMFPKDTIANGGDDMPVQLYNQEKAAMLYTFDWNIGSFTPEVVEVTEIISVPEMDGAETDPASFKIGGSSMGLFINKKSFENPAAQEAITDFVDFILSDEMFTELVKSGMLPAKKFTIDKSITLPLFNMVYEFTKNQETYLNSTKSMTNSDVISVFKSGVDELFAGAVTPEQFVDNVQTAMDKAKSEGK